MGVSLSLSPAVVCRVKTISVGTIVSLASSSLNWQRVYICAVLRAFALVYQVKCREHGYICVKFNH